MLREIGTNCMSVMVTSTSGRPVDFHELPENIAVCSHVFCSDNSNNWIKPVVVPAARIRSSVENARDE